jgi:hypothetical protein
MLDLPSTFDDPPDLMSAGARCTRCDAGVERVVTLFGRTRQARSPATLSRSAP